MSGDSRLGQPPPEVGGARGKTAATVADRRRIAMPGRIVAAGRGTREERPDPLIARERETVLILEDGGLWWPQATMGLDHGAGLLRIGWARIGAAASAEGLASWGLARQGNER